MVMAFIVGALMVLTYLVKTTCGDGIIGGGTHGANIFGEVQLVVVAFIVGALIVLIYLVRTTCGDGIIGGGTHDANISGKDNLW